MKFWEWLSDYKFGIFNHYWWNDVWYKHVSARWNPRQKWLTKHIPRTWQDKDTILETVVLECLKHYVDEEGEDCFHIIDTEAECQRDFYKEVRHYYELTTQKLVALQKELDAEWDKIHLDPPSWKDINKGTHDDYERKYGKINRLEKEISELKTDIMVWVVKNREGLWT